MSRPAKLTGSRIRGSPVVLLGSILNVLAALAFGGLHLLLEPPPLRGVVWPGAVALAVAYAVPAALAVVALRGRRPAALLGAGLVGVPLAFTALSGVSLVLLVPAVCYLAGYATWRPRPPLRAGAVAGVAAVLAAGVAALVLLFAAPVGEPRQYCYSGDPGQGSGCTSDVVTPAEAALGLGAAAVALAVGARLPRARG
jgi:hypothetical protein